MEWNHKSIAELFGQHTNKQEENNILLNYQFVKEEFIKGTRNCLEMDENKNAAKAVLREKFIAINTCIKKKQDLKSIIQTCTLRN